MIWLGGLFFGSLFNDDARRSLYTASQN